MTDRRHATSVAVPGAVAPGAFREAPLPASRGPVSESVIASLRAGTPITVPGTAGLDPWSDDVQLTLVVCQELHYGGWRDVPAAREWDAGLIGLRVELEKLFLCVVDEAAASRYDRGERDSGDSAPDDDHASAAPDPEAEFTAMMHDAARDDGASGWLRAHGGRREFADNFAVRSLYHLKEADPHAWAIPRLPPSAKAAFVAVEFDEFGGGRADRVHQALFADLLDDFGMRSEYFAYLDSAPAVALAPVTLMSALGLRRERRGAVVGHFAATEYASSPGSAALLAGLERIDAPERVRHFYREHVEADAVHEQVMRDGVIGGLLRIEPHLTADVVAGIRAFRLVEDLLGEALVDAWRSGRTVATGR